MGWLCFIHHGYHCEVQAHSLSHDDNVTEVQKDSQSIPKGTETWNFLGEAPVLHLRLIF